MARTPRIRGLYHRGHGRRDRDELRAVPQGMI